MVSRTLVLVSRFCILLFQQLDRLLPGINLCVLFGPRHPANRRIRSRYRKEDRKISIPNKTSRYQLKDGGPDLTHPPTPPPLKCPPRGGGRIEEGGIKILPGGIKNFRTGQIPGLKNTICQSDKGRPQKGCRRPPMKKIDTKHLFLKH